MEENKDQQTPNMSPVEPEEIEIGHADKLVGVFSEPGKTFTKMVKAGAKTSDWLIPVVILIAVSILSTILMSTNPSIRLQMQQERENQIQEMVEKGTLIQSQADQQIEAMEKFSSGPFMIITTSIAMIIFIFVFFFIISALIMLFVKLILKGEGTYKDAMTAYGLPFYILVIQVIVMVILSLSMGKAFQSTGIASFMNLEKGSFVNFILSKVDVFSIWFYAVLSIAFAKMFRSQSIGKYYALIFSLWIFSSVIFFFIGKAVPFLSFLSR